MIRKLIREIKVHRAIRNIFKDANNLNRLNEFGFDIDWIGRIYGIVQVDAELLGMQERTWQEQYDKMNAIDIFIKDKLVPLVRFFNELQISNLLIYPDNYEQFEGTNDFLVVLQPESKYYSPKKLIVSLSVLVPLIVIACVACAIFL